MDFEQLSIQSCTVEGPTDTPSLIDLNLEVNKGDFLGIIGPSGSGKSSLVSLLCGAVPHHWNLSYSGFVKLNGLDTNTLALTDISRIIACVMEDIDAQMVASIVEDELLFGLENFGVPHEEIPGRLQEVLSLLDMEDLLYRDIATLSGGQKQKVALAAILALKPSALILDEPTAALDPKSSAHIFEILDVLNRDHHLTIIVVEQKVGLLARYCSRLAIMSEGRIVLQGRPDEVFTQSTYLREIGVDSPRATRVYNSLRKRALIAENTLPALDNDQLICMIAACCGSRTQQSEAQHRATTPSELQHAGAFSCDEDLYPDQPELASSTPVVELTNVSFTYPTGHQALNQVSYRVMPGEFLAILGQNGAGKTTLTKLMCGLLTPQEGICCIDGTPTQELGPVRIAQMTSVLFQNPDHQLCCDSILEEVLMSLRLKGIVGAEAEQRAHEAIEYFNLDPQAYPPSLSRGEKQIVALCCIVALQPRLIILDEPTSGLDYRECMTVMQAISDICAHGAAVIMVSHDMEVISDFAHTGLLMYQGQALMHAPLAKLYQARELLAQACVEPPQIVLAAQRLSIEVDPRFAHCTQVRELVDVVEELIHHG